MKKKIFDCFLNKVLNITLGLLFPQQLFELGIIIIPIAQVKN